MSPIASSRMRHVFLPLAFCLVLLLLGGGGLMWLDRPEAAGQEEQSPESSELRSLPEEPADDGDVSAAPQELGGQPFVLCEGCHPDYEQMPPETGDLIFSHEVHTGADVRCATCHNDALAHFGQPAPLMMTCLSCHEGETAPNECRNCHRRLEEIAPGLEEPVVHLDPDVRERRTCEKCHDVDTWCEQCHGVVMPHPAEVWEDRHGEVALTEVGVCDKCHQARDPVFCVECHQVEMPHPAFWYSQHGDIASANEEACGRCHEEAPQYCNSCHHAGYSPTEDWLPEEHGRAVESEGPERCLVCHDEEFCARCHQSGRFTKQ